MAQFVVMPKAGNSVESCILLSWAVAVGDTVEEATILCEAETDKSTIEVLAGASGTVLALIANVGDEIPVMATIAVVGEPGEAYELPVIDLVPHREVPDTTGAPAPIETTESQAPPADIPVSELSLAVSPYARSLAAERGVDWRRLPGSGPRGRVIARDIRSAPATTRAASGAPVPPGMPHGTGLGGRYTREDLALTREDLAAAASPLTTAGPPVDTAEFPGAVTESRLTGIRKLVADRMLHSVSSTATVTYAASASAAGLLALRARFKNSDPGLGLDTVTLGDLVNFAAIRTATRHAVFSAHLDDGLLRVFDEVHLGIAVDTPRGLLVPTVRFASRLGLRELATHTKALVGAAQSGAINPDLLSGASFTVSNLGAFGIESFSPIINAPQTAILGVDAISTRAALGASGELIAEQRIGFSLTADHRVIDGADAARFLRDLTRLIADIDLAVIG